MSRRLLAGLFAIALLLIPAPAFAQPPVTETTQQKNAVDTFVDFLPSCEPGAPLYTFTTTQNIVVQSTTFDDGRVSGTVIQTGTFTAVPLSDPTLPTYTGKVNLHNTFHVENGALFQNTFTVTVHGTGSDGSTFETHFTQHANVTPTATINEFFRCH
jgi:hypothetical protein